MALTEFIYALNSITWSRRLLALNLLFFISLPIIVQSLNPLYLLLNKFGFYFSPCGLGRPDSTFLLLWFMSWTMNWLFGMWKFGAKTTIIVTTWPATVVCAIHASVTPDPDVKYREHRIMPNEVFRSESPRTVHKLTFGMTVEQLRFWPPRPSHINHVCSCIPLVSESILSSRQVCRCVYK